MTRGCCDRAAAHTFPNNRQAARATTLSECRPVPERRRTSPRPESPCSILLVTFRSPRSRHVGLRSSSACAPRRRGARRRGGRRRVARIVRARGCCSREPGGEPVARGGSGMAGVLLAERVGYRGGLVGDLGATRRPRDLAHGRRVRERRPQAPPDRDRRLRPVRRGVGRVHARRVVPVDRPRAPHCIPSRPRRLELLGRLRRVRCIRGLESRRERDAAPAGRHRSARLRALTRRKRNPHHR